MTADRPYVSFISYFRNDGYTSDFELRVQRASQFLVHQLIRAGIPSELLLVEWNPPPDRPLIIDNLGPLPQGESVRVRGIVVGEDHHRRFLGSDDWGMNPAAAANVGLRRAEGQFITPKAADSYLSQEIVELLSRRDLRDDGMYRCDRVDVLLSATDLEERDDDVLLARLESMDGQRHGRLPPMSHWHVRDLHTNACGDFLLMSRAMWHTLRGFPLDGTVLSLDCDSMVMHAAVALGQREICLPADCRVFKGVHSRLFSSRVTQVFDPWQESLDGLLTRLRWWRLQTMLRGHFDFPRRKVRGVEALTAPSIERKFVRPAEAWAKGVVPELGQPANWGLGDQPLDERLLCRAHWDVSGGVAAA